jgi:acetyl esterase/lipase
MRNLPLSPPRLCLFAIVLASVFVVAALAQEPNDAKRPASLTQAEQLKIWLKQFPAADANGDGTLTLEEAQAYRRKLQALQAIPKPEPDQRNVAYGPHERNVLDLWQARSDRPTPLVVFIHGGGFLAGDKSNVPPPLLERCLHAGISVASINYRYSTQAPFPGPMLDGARAVQFLRSKAAPWNLDPTRFAASGGSAGAGISLWIGFHDDLADPASADPVARQSTRLSCMGVLGAQSSYDPREIKEWIGGRAHEHPALMPFYGLKADELDTPKAYKLYEAASAINYVTADDPPVFMYYNEPPGPLPPDARPGQGIHHPKFGEALKAKLDPLGIECVLRHQDEYVRGEHADMFADMVAFFQRIFKAAKSPGKSSSGAGR